MLRWWASMLYGSALLGWVLWTKKAFQEDEEETRDDELRGFMFRLGRPFVLGIGLLLLLNGLVRLLIAVSN
jgi:uncharacterized iron-regulated membrane protein